MSIDHVWIDSEYPLEGILSMGLKNAGAVLCHPHPLYGGSMSNNVVIAMEQGFRDLGFTVLKFNFRGVGESRGFYAEGEGETKDLLSATRFLESVLDVHPRIILGGYSFGAWICAKVAKLRVEISDLFLVSYPFAFYEIEEVRDFKKRIYLVSGYKDTISPVNLNLLVYQSLPQLEKYLHVIETDHFYVGKEKSITSFIKRAFL